MTKTLSDKTSLLSAVTFELINLINACRIGQDSEYIDTITAQLHAYREEIFATHLNIQVTHMQRIMDEAYAITCGMPPTAIHLEPDDTVSIHYTDTSNHRTAYEAIAYLTTILIAYPNLKTIIDKLNTPLAVSDKEYEELSDKVMLAKKNYCNYKGEVT